VKFSDIIILMEVGERIKKMAAPWDNPNKINPDKPFVSCEEEYELEYLANKYNVSISLVRQCCEEVPAPHSRKKVEECIKRNKT